MTTVHTPELTIAVTDRGTSFSGAATVHRYDRPTTAEIVAVVESMLGPEPGGAWVHLIAAPGVIAEFEALTSDYDITLTVEDLDDLEEDLEEDSAEPQEETDDESREKSPEEPLAVWSGDVGEQWYEETSISEAPYDDAPYDTDVFEVPIQRPVLKNERGLSRSSATIGAVVVLVAMACAAAIWLASRDTSTDEAAPAAPSPSQTVSTALPSPPATTEQVEPEEPDTVVLEQDGLSVELPVGFQLEPDEDMWRAVGPDPDFRLQLAVDPLYGVPAEALIEQVLREIEADPEMTVTATDEVSVEYAHHLPDGSEAVWKTWVDGDQQISIGCHTRTAPTVVQKTTCTMANDSARFTPE